MTALERFKQYLSKRNLRMTAERLVVLEEVLADTGHFTTSELVARMQQKDIATGRSTVYRVIPHLLQAGVIGEVSAKEGREEQIYENIANQRHHDHLTCELCGEVVEFENAEIHRLQEKVATHHGYRLRRHVQHLRGICPECQEKIIEGF
jgi:Fur family transcriptional regulator, ferric uptake regulator